MDKDTIFKIYKLLEHEDFEFKKQGEILFDTLCENKEDFLFFLLGKASGLQRIIISEGVLLAVS